MRSGVALRAGLLRASARAPVPKRDGFRPLHIPNAFQREVASLPLPSSEESRGLPPPRCQGSPPAPHAVPPIFLRFAPCRRGRAPPRAPSLTAIPPAHRREASQG